jgi:hypothetical protein
MLSGARRSARSMASLAPLSSMKKRSDRFVCKLKDYDAKSIKVIGSDGGLGLQDRKENSVHPWDCVVSVDLLPSCHRGLVLTIAPNGPARVGELDRESPDGRSLGINKGGSLFLSFCSCSFLCSMRKIKNRYPCGTYYYFNFSELLHRRLHFL